MSGSVRKLVSRLSWITVSHVVTSVLRLLNNVVLARLLAPSLLGMMTIVSLVRTGIELFTDVGIGQNIVSNKNGHDPDFYDTAWTGELSGRSRHRSGPRLHLVCAICG